ncbi:MAG: hypothetical protein ACPGGK_15480 [Pikeienuella sp.]
MRIFYIAAIAALVGCTDLPEDNAANPESKVDWVNALGDRVPILKSDTILGIAAANARAKYPNLRAANQTDGEKWRDAHPSAFGVKHGELAGFGVTMVRHTGSEPFTAHDAFTFSDGDLEKPTLLFFEKENGFPKNWRIIGMGYAFEYADDDGDEVADLEGFDWDIVEGWYFMQDGLLVHEAGYHLLNLNPGFRIADNDNLTNDARDDGLTVDTNGENVIQHADMRASGIHPRHGRMSAMHVWFHPTNGRPTVSPCDPWHRQDDRASELPRGTFYYRNDPPSRPSVERVCNTGGAYPTVEDFDPEG